MKRPESSTNSDNDSSENYDSGYSSDSSFEDDDSGYSSDSSFENNDSRYSGDSSYENNDSGYSSDSSSENYYLWCEEETDFIKFVENHLASERAAGRLSSKDYPPSLIQDLMDRMQQNKNWEQIHGDADYIKKAIAHIDKEIKKKRAPRERCLKKVLALIHKEAKKQSSATANRKRSTKRKAGDRGWQKRYRMVAAAYFRKVLALVDKEVKKKSAAAAYQKRSMKRKAGDRDRLGKRKMRCSPSNRLTGFGASTSHRSPLTTRTPSGSSREILASREPSKGGNIGGTSSGDPIPSEGGATGETSSGDSLVLRRKLNKSDMDDHQHRLSMPCNQALRGQSFLTEEELESLNKKLYVPIKVIDPASRVYDANLRKIRAGPRTHSFAIGKPWNTVKKENGFRAGMVIDIFAFRGEEKELCFRLQRVGEESTP